jgi:hypothetical protein
VNPHGWHAVRSIDAGGAAPDLAVSDRLDVFTP